MNTYDNKYLNLVDDIIKNGKSMPCRTGDNVKKVYNRIITTDLEEGFPIITFRGGIPFKGVKGELSCFLNGITKKSEFVKRGCNYWSSWCNPKKIPAGLSDKERKEFQLKEEDLGNIYGYEILHFGYPYEDCDTDYTGKGFNQLEYVVNTLKKDPYSRRIIISMWNPAHMDTMSLTPCMHQYQFNYDGEKLHITAIMRSVDICCGFPADMCYISLLLHLMCQTVGMKPGTATIITIDTHIYDTHFKIIEENIEKWYNTQYDLPKLILDSSATVFNFIPEMASLENYQHGERVVFPVSV